MNIAKWSAIESASSRVEALEVEGMINSSGEIGRSMLVAKPVMRLILCLAAVIMAGYLLDRLAPPGARAFFLGTCLLFIIFTVSINWGFRYALATSLFAGSVFSWLLPPVFSLRISETRNIVALIAFLAMGITGSYLSGRVRKEAESRKRAEEATERERERLHQLQANLTRINRVSTMGELTASLAHEINQPIAAAMTNACTCLRWLSAKAPNIDEARDAASRIVKDTERAAQIIVHLRSLFKRGPMEREPIEINELMEEMMVLLRREAMRYSICIQEQLAGDPLKVIGDRVQLQQVIMNLMVNAIDAIKATGPFDRRELTLTSHANGSRELMISIRDTGVGLPPEPARIFEAFYSTKPDGSGMGLAISRTIIEAHGGRLWATSNPDGGATFNFTLPLLEA
jgi:signal transduction histidine kinase